MVTILFVGCDSKPINSSSEVTSSEAVSNKPVSDVTVSSEMASSEIEPSEPISSTAVSSKSVSSATKEPTSSMLVSSKPIKDENGLIEPDYERTTGVMFNVLDINNEPIEGFGCNLGGPVPDTATPLESREGELAHEGYSGKTQYNGSVVLLINSYHEKTGTAYMRLSTTKGAFKATATIENGKAYDFTSENSDNKSWGKLQSVQIKPDLGHTVIVNVVVEFLDE